MRDSTNPVLLHAFATEMLARRQELQLSQRDIETRAGIDRAYISRLEAGKKHPSLSVLYQLATALEMSFSEFAGRVDERYVLLERKAKAAAKALQK